MKVQVPTRIAIPAAIAIAFAILGYFGLMSILENRVFDTFLHFRKPPVEQTKFITLVDFDDQAVEKAGTWPIGRDVMADGVMLLRECGSRYAVFDIEYVDKSPRGVNSDLLTNNIPESFNNEFGSIGNQMGEFITALQRGSIPLREAGSYVKDFQGLIQNSKDSLQSQVTKIARDNDEYLAQALRFHGNAFMTIHLVDPKNDRIPADEKALALDRFALKDVETKGPLIQSRPDIQPPILPVEQAAKGLGFTNVSIDSDGVRRRVAIVARYGDRYFPQLVIAPMLDYLGHPKVIVGRREVILENAKYPDGTVRTVRLPLDQEGRILINWPHAIYEKSFESKHISFAELIAHKEQFDNLHYNLKLREGWGYLQYYQGETPLLDIYNQAEALKQLIMEGSESPERVADYRALRDRFLAEVGAYLDSKPDERIAADIAKVLADRKTKAKDREDYERIQKDIPVYFAGLRNNYKTLMAYRGDIVSKVDGCLCLLGQTNTGSTDIGVNPFDNQFKNVGTHASLANMILDRDFISEAPNWISALLAILLTAALVLGLRNTKPLITIIAGAASCVAVFGLDVLLFTLTGVYVAVLPPMLSIFLTFIALTFIQFLETEREKGFIRNAFGHYLSEAVIKDIVGNPDKLKLGGELRHMTAMFTDIKGFSTISEKLTAEELVRLLNEYLTNMSNLVLDHGGTIDKYEGDAIICFFGAPLDLPNHALRCCQAAIRMKKKEAEINVRFLETGLAPSNLLTRMGINTGEMVVGNMGTTKKMDYTIMGDSVNLAARLEGVNKQYGTWLCVSEDTMNEAKDGIVVRRLDRIRVVGKSQPIRIFELVDEKGQVEQKKADVIGLFEQALGQFENRQWDETEVILRKVLAIDPDDGPSKTYLDRVAKYKVTPPPADWDGVFNLTQK